jgi:hypothetical protein
MLSVRVRVRGAVGTLDTFEEIVKSLDVSRDGDQCAAQSASDP